MVARGGPQPVFTIQLKTEQLQSRSLEQRVKFVGVEPEDSFITITRELPGKCCSMHASTHVHCVSQYTDQDHLSHPLYLSYCASMYLGQLVDDTL